MTTTTVHQVNGDGRRERGGASIWRAAQRAICLSLCLSLAWPAHIWAQSESPVINDANGGGGGCPDASNPPAETPQAPVQHFASSGDFLNASGPFWREWLLAHTYIPPDNSGQWDPPNQITPDLADQYGDSNATTPATQDSLAGDPDPNAFSASGDFFSGAAGDTPMVADPINAATGNLVLSQTDYVGRGPFPLEFRRFYNSLSKVPRSSYFWNDIAGVGWRMSYRRAIVRIRGQAGPTVSVVRDNGQSIAYQQLAGVWTPVNIDPNSGTVTPNKNVVGSLTSLLDAAGNAIGWQHVTAGDSIERYDDGGLLQSIALRNGLTQTLSYDVDGNLASVADPFGRALTFSYDAAGRLATMTAPGGATTAYAYDAGGNLVSSTNALGGLRGFVYENTTYPHALTGVLDENGTRLSSWTYDANGRAVSSSRAGNTSTVAITYNPDGSTIVKDARGVNRVHTFVDVFGALKPSGVTVSCTDCSSGMQRTTTYDTSGYIASSTDFNGVTTQYTFDSTRGLELTRVQAAGTPLARTITTTWHPTFRLPTQIAYPTATVTMTYDALGNILRRNIVGGGQTRTWAFTYNANSQVTSIDGPRTDVSDVTTFTYDSSGNPATITDPLGRVGKITSYDVNGRPLAMIDRNGVTSTLAYSVRGALTSYSRAGLTLAFAYDARGKITKTTFPNASARINTYDAAGRLSTLADNTGNVLRFTRDTSGLVTQVNVLDATGTTIVTRSYAYNQLGRLTKEVGAAGQSWTYSYDTKGRLLGVVDPLGRTASRTYDALDRLISTTDPKAGVTAMSWDSADRMTVLSDARSLATRYSYDGLGNVTSIASADAGTSTSTFDAAGNLRSRLDAKGQNTAFSYDAMNRMLSATYADQTSKTYAYDTGANAIGRLSKLTDSSGSTAYEWDALGRMTRQTRLVGTQSQQATHAYDAAGQLASMTYPSGRVQLYTRNALGQVTQIGSNLAGTNTTILSNAVYFPFGGVKSFTYGNGQSFARSIDLDGQITQYAQGPQSFRLGYDAASRITGRTDTANAANAQTFGYDVLDRLTSYTDTATSQSYGYDATGNRTTYNVGATAYTNAFPLTSNRISSASGPTARTFTTDANGSITNDSLIQYAYDARGRMTQATAAASSASYKVNGQGQRVLKTAAGITTAYQYDAGGLLVGESDGANALQREYVYLGGLPVALFAAASAGAVCSATPTVDVSGTFKAFSATQGLIGRSAGKRDGSEGDDDSSRGANGSCNSGENDDDGCNTTSQPAWSLGADTSLLTNSVHHGLSWVSGKAYGFTLTYDGKGNGTYTVLDGKKLLWSQTFKASGSNQLKTGNAVQFSLNAIAGLSTAKVALLISSINGTTVNKTIQTAGNNTASTVSVVYAGQTLSAGQSIAGTVTMTFKGEDSRPVNDALNFKITAGNVSCGGTGTGAPSAYYVHPDYLGTPRAVTNAGAQLMWRWDSDPFGVSPPNENPAGRGPFTLNLRFAGQYFDQETGLHNNGFRDYDPKIGRYVQSDPIGLAGGINTYSYAGGNPISISDSRGLDNPSMGPYGSHVSYSRSAGDIVVTNTDNSTSTYPAGNNTTRASRGPWADGAYNYGYSTTHPDDAPDSAYGSNGNAVYTVPGCSGCGIHSGRQSKADGLGRTGVDHATLGCIRTTDEATRNIRDLIRNGDPPNFTVGP